LLDGEFEYGLPGISDVNTTTVTLTIDGRTVTQSAYSLSYQEASDTGLSAANIAARKALQGFIDTAHGLAGDGMQEYVPPSVLAYRLSAESAPPVVEEGLERQPRPWPIATVPAPATTSIGSCIEVTGAEATTLLAALDGANELTRWLIGAQAPTRMAFRPLLPGDPGCPE